MSMSKTVEETIEILGEVIEACLNYAEYGKNSTTPDFANSLPATMRIDALSNGLADVHAKVRDLYLELGGDDVWND